MENSVIYPILSFISLFYLFLFLNKPVYISKYCATALFFVLSSFWCFFAGFNGDDMVNYLDYFSRLNLNYLGLYGSPIEFTVALFPALLKATFSITDERTLMIAHRLFTFSLLPSVILLFVKNRSNFLPIFVCLIVFLFLLPYTFLSLTNVILNGFSLALLSYSMLLILPFEGYQYTTDYRRYLFKRNIFIVILLYLSFFAHGYGTISVGLLIIGGIFISALAKFRILSFKSKFSSLLLTSSIMLPLCFVTGRILLTKLTSTNFDESILLSSSICAFTIYLSRSMFNIFTPSSLNDILHINLRSKVNYFWFLVFFLSVVSIILGIFGGGDAAERFVAGSLNLNILFYVYYAVMYRNTSKLRLENINTLNRRSFFLPFLNCSLIFVLLVMNIYFYNSQAFLSNI